MRAFGTSIRARLVLLVLVATLPLLLFSGALVYRAYETSEEFVEDAAVGYARRLGVAIDGQVGRAQAVAQALAGLSAGDFTDVAEFEQAAARALTAAGLDGSLSLVGQEGAPVAQTSRGADGIAPPPGDPQLVRRVFETGQPQVSGLFTDPASEQRQIALHVPVVRDGRIRFDAIIAVSARSVAAALEPEVLPEEWFAVLADAGNVTIARTLNPSLDIGDPVTPTFAALAAQSARGFGPAISREGVPIFVGYTRSVKTGWLVGVAVPQSIVRGPLLQSLAALLGGGGALLAATLGLAWFAGRAIAHPVGALANEAARLGAGEMPDPEAGRGLVEAEAAARALHAAGQLLSRRDQEREAALRRAEGSEARLLLAQEIGQIGVWETDIRTGRRTWSERQCALFGVDPSVGPPQGSSASALIHPDDRARVLATLSRAYATPMSYNHEFRVLLPGGEVRWLQSAGRSIFRDGVPVSLVGITMDVTERHRSERDLRESAARLESEVAARTRELAESEERFRTYFENSADAMVVVRVDGPDRFVFETINRASENLLGLLDREIAGKTPEDVLLPETAEAVIKGFREVVATGLPLRLERTLALPSATLDLESMLVPVWDIAGKRVARIISGQRDLSERRRIEGRMSHAQRLEAVGQLTGGVAHDFNNLLTVVIGNLSLLRRRLGNDERAARYLSSVEAAAERGAKLTASLLAFSRRQKLEVEPLDVGAQLSESATLLRRALGEDIEFSINVSPGVPLAVADAAQLEAAVLNLVINARDALLEKMAEQQERHGSVRIRVTQAVLLASDLEGNNEAKPGRFVAVEVQDTGSGMPADVRARAFEPFFTTKEVGKGTGLGLSQVFGFVRQLGGHIMLDSTPGQGTRAVLYLPLAPVAHRVEDIGPAAPPPVPEGATVLVVEDDDGIRDVTGEVLQDAGLEVLRAADGPSALEILRGAARVDVLFSDVVMPGGATGVDLARQAHALRPGLPVLLTSGYGGPSLSRYGADGEFEVLAKPYTRTVLLQRLGRMLATVPV